MSMQLAKNIFIVKDFLSDKECDELTRFSEMTGFQAAAVGTEKGTKLIPEVRNNERLLYKDDAFAQKLWDKLSPFVPIQIGNSVAIGLNELFRYYKYGPGQKFSKHIDESFIRNELEASYYTFMVYLNDDFEGGETKFDSITINAEKGMGLIFLHSLPHEGAAVIKGFKYVLRTDIIYRLIAE